MTLSNGASVPNWLLTVLASALLGALGFGSRTLFVHESRLTAVETGFADQAATLKRIEQKVDGLYVARQR
jgi:hypothetical protein